MSARRAILGVWLLVLGLLACTGGGDASTTAVLSDRDGVFTIRGGQRDTLPAPEQDSLDEGDAVDVDAAGRAIVQFADLFTVEVLRDGGLEVREVRLDDQSAIVTVVQNGGTLLNQSAADEIAHRFTIESDFATITATGTRFLVVREAETPLEWVLALDAPPDELTVSAAGETKPVETGIARWVAPIGAPSAGITYDAGRVEQWITNVQAGGVEEEIGEVLWPQADVQVSTAPLGELPAPDAEFEMAGVMLRLDPDSPFGTPRYALQDCNGDGVRDVAMQNGVLHLDFRNVPRRVRALDVTILNASEPGTGALTSFSPAQEEMDRQLVSVGRGELEVLPLRSPPGHPYHYATLALSEGCFLGFSLTPPDGSPPRPAVPLEGRTVPPPPTLTVPPTLTLPPTLPPIPPVATPTPTAAPPLCRVTSQAGLFARSGPGREYPILVPVAFGAVVQPLARTEAGDWLQVSLSGVPGAPDTVAWMSAVGGTLTCNVEPLSLPVAEAVPPPSTPTTTPTATHVTPTVPVTPRRISRPDLIVRAVQVPDVLYRGVPIGDNVRLFILNQGESPVTDSDLQVVISASETLDEGTVLLGRGAIGRIEPGQTVELALNPETRVPVTAPVGRVYLGVILDPSNKVAESNERNNGYATRVTVLTVPQ